MKSLKTLLATKPSMLKALDIAYLTVILPLLFILKLPMLLFILISMGLIAAHKKPTTLTLLITGMFGMAAIFFSFYGSFNFSGLSRLKLFVELLIYLLLLAVLLQRLTTTINFYLKISPALLLSLGLFFFHGIPMLIYVLFTVFVLVSMILWQIMQTELRTALGVSTLFCLASLPIVIVFFIFFPRISFEHATYGFKGDAVHRTGHDGLMYLDSNALLVPSDKVVMEVGFDQPIPPASQLYFRGSVLYTKKNNIWQPLSTSTPLYTPLGYSPEYPESSYKIRLYPTGKSWLYLLEFPSLLPKRSSMNIHMETVYKTPISEPLLYKARSSLRSIYPATLDSQTKKAALAYDATKNQKSQHFMSITNAKVQDPLQRLEAIKTFFKSQKLTYSLKPDPLDLNNSADSFLFEKKKGYCVHFADAFATLVRMAKIPSRIVTGYKSDGTDSIESYLMIREKDAHAWVEVYLDGMWQRVEPTAFASAVSDIQLQDTKKTSDFNRYILFIKYQIETWILEYSTLSQKRLFGYLKSDTLFLLEFVFGLLIIIGSIFVTAYFLIQQRCKDKLLCPLAPLLKKLSKIGFPRYPNESLNTYFVRIEALTSLPLSRLNEIYHLLRYKSDSSKELFERFQQEISTILKKLN